MSFFEWKDEFSVNISAIDAQHRKIIELMDELFESIRDNREELVIREILDDLAQYTKYHFSLEAELFRTYNYQKAGEHLAEHRFFAERVAGLKKEVATDASGASMETLDFLRGWFQNHMLKIDGDYSLVFKEKGLIKDIEDSMR